MSAKTLARDGILLALAVAFSFLESCLPLPVGVKLGLSSLIIMYALLTLSTAEAFSIALLKSCFVLLMRGFTAGILSCAGGMLSLFGMLFLFRMHGSILLISALGGLLHNIGQLCASMILLHSDAVWGYLPILAITGISAGIINACLFRLLMPFLPETRALLQNYNYTERQS